MSSRIHYFGTLGIFGEIRNAQISTLKKIKVLSFLLKGDDEDAERKA